VPLFWLNYRHPRGRFAGAAVIESSSLVSARMAAAVYGLNDRLEFASGHQLDQGVLGLHWPAASAVDAKRGLRLRLIAMTTDLRRVVRPV